MGEMIKQVGSIDVGKESFRIELNHSPLSSAKHEVHIQNEAFRLAVTEEDFCRMATAVLLARKQLHQIKGMNEESSRERKED